MTMQEFIIYQEVTFEAYCKKLIRNTGKNARKAIVRRARHEVNHSMLPKVKLDYLGSEDAYDLDSTIFFVRGIPVKVSDPALSRALATLTPYRREVILMFYFMDRSEPQIAAALHRDHSTINYQRKQTLKRLKEALEVLEHGK